MVWSDDVGALVGDYISSHSVGDTLIYVQYNGPTIPQFNGGGIKVSCIVSL